MAEVSERGSEARELRHVGGVKSFWRRERESQLVAVREVVKCGYW